MHNPMETNKLLTLEEIEEMQAGIDSLRETYINVTESMQSIPKMDTLLATARAYWELRKNVEQAVRIELSMDNELQKHWTKFLNPIPRKTP
jgi:hypothetical protein